MICLVLEYASDDRGYRMLDACGLCTQKHWPEFQADPTPAWWHDATLCPASPIYCTEPLLAPWTAP